jgi:uncharacterized protein DUF5666
MKAFKQTLVLAAVGLMASLSLVACGGGGGGGGTTAATTTVSKGVIQQFGSVKVNGVEFKTVGATLHLRDDATTPNRVLQTETEIRDLLKLGMVVTVKGRIDDNGTTGTATEIEFRDTLKGRIEAKVDDRLTIMGQTVIVDDSLRSSLGNFNVGDDVQVSGIIDDKGGLRATHLERKTGLGEFEAKGFVKDFTGPGDTVFTLLLSPTAATGITVNIGLNTQLPAAGIKNGDFVEVKADASAGTLTAKKIEIEDELKAGENENMEFEGFISSIIDGDNFVVNGQTVRTTSATVFRGGAKADLAVGMKVEAEGSFVGGVLIASKVSFKDNFRINATATAVDTGAKTVILLGKTIFFTGATEFNGFTDPNALLNQNVEIRGILDATGKILASRIDLKGAPRDDAFIRGVVTAKTPTTSLTIAGIAINTTVAEFKDRNDALISGTVFFDAISLNATAVKAKWKFAAPITTNFDPSATPVKEVELEN